MGPVHATQLFQTCWIWSLGMLTAGVLGVPVTASAQTNSPPAVHAPAVITLSEDTPQALTGITFADEDAGSSPVRVTFSVTDGRLTAAAVNGVMVSGSASQTLVLAGSLPDINAFLAQQQVVFTPAIDFSGYRVLTVQIDDQGHTGTGGAQTDTTTTTLEVISVNDAPVVEAPGTQVVARGGTLLFSPSTGNGVTISDVDLHGGPLEVTLSATQGLLSLGSTAGLAFTTGSGSNNATMTFQGNGADVDLALQGLVFFPMAGYVGPAALTVAVNDLGNTGAGGAQMASRSIPIMVQPEAAAVQSVGSLNANGLYKQGDVLTLAVAFDRAVQVTGTPMLRLATGGAACDALYVGGSGTSELQFAYTVQAGDLSADLDYSSTTALGLAGGRIEDAAVPGASADLALPPPGEARSLAGQHALVIDGVAPQVLSSAPVGTPPASSTTVDFLVQFSEPVTGLSLSDFTITATGTATGSAQLLSGSGTAYVVQVQGIAGAGTVRVDLRAGASAADAAGNQVMPAGFTGGAPFVAAGPSIPVGPVAAIPALSGAGSAALAVLLSALGAAFLRCRTTGANLGA